MKRLIAILLFSAMAASCIDYGAEITINLDGSGEIQVRYGVDDTVSSLPGAAGQPALPQTSLPDRFPKDAEALTKSLSAPGLQVSDVFVFPEKGMLNGKAKVKFENIQDLEKAPFFEGMRFSFYPQVGKMIFKGSIRGMPEVLDEYDLSSLGGTQPGDTPAVGVGLSDEAFAKMIIKGIFQDQNLKDKYKFKTKVTLPRPVENANSNQIEGNSVTWDFSLGDLMGKDKLELEARMKLTRLDRIKRWGWETWKRWNKTQKPSEIKEEPAPVASPAAETEVKSNG